MLSVSWLNYRLLCCWDEEGNSVIVDVVMLGMPNVFVPTLERVALFYGGSNKPHVIKEFVDPNPMDAMKRFQRVARSRPSVRAQPRLHNDKVASSLP